MVAEIIIGVMYFLVVVLFAVREHQHAKLVSDLTNKLFARDGNELRMIQARPMMAVKPKDEEIKRARRPLDPVLGKTY